LQQASLVAGANKRASDWAKMLLLRYRFVLLALVYRVDIGSDHQAEYEEKPRLISRG
jgi:hypothetical protein